MHRDVMSSMGIRKQHDRFVSGILCCTYCNVEKRNSELWAADRRSGLHEYRSTRYKTRTAVNIADHPAAVPYLGFGKGGPWRARRARAYNVWSGAEPPAGSRGRAPGQGVRRAKLKHFFAFKRSMEAANSPIFWKFGNAEHHSVISDAMSHGDF